MAGWLDVLDAFPSALKLGWIVWIAWGIGQIAWYRHDRRSIPQPVRPALPATTAPRLPAPFDQQHIEETFDAADPVFEPPLHVDAVTPEAEMSAPNREVVLDPADALDHFVAQFEPSNRRRRRRKARASENAYSR